MREETEIEAQLHLVRAETATYKLVCTEIKILMILG